MRKRNSHGLLHLATIGFVQFSALCRMFPNPGNWKVECSWRLVKKCRKGITSWVAWLVFIDQQRYNSVLGEQLFYEIKTEKLTNMLEDCALSVLIHKSFGISCSQIATTDDYKFLCSFSMAKDSLRRVLPFRRVSSTYTFDGSNVYQYWNRNI